MELSILKINQLCGQVNLINLDRELIQSKTTIGEKL
jgi:hypothetical protein